MTSEPERSKPIDSMGLNVACSRQVQASSVTRIQRLSGYYKNMDLGSMLFQELIPGNVSCDWLLSSISKVCQISSF